MRDFARRYGLIRRLPALGIGGVVAVMGMAVFAGSASAAAELTVSAAWSQNPIAAGQDISLVYTVKDTNATDEADGVNNITFNDTLPAGVVLSGPADDNGVLKNCTGPVGADDYTSSGSSVAVGPLSLPAGNAGSCTISFEVTPTTVGSGLVDAITGVKFEPVSTSANDTGTATNAAALSVVADPTLTVSPSPSGTHTYKWGQTVDTYWTDTVASGDSVNSLFGLDSLGDELSSGDPLNTWVVGKDQNLQVFLTTNDGGSVIDTITYDVTGLALSDIKTTGGGSVSFKTGYPSKGTLKAEILDGKKVVGKLTKKIGGKKKSLSETVNPSASGRGLLGGGIKATLEVSFTPKGEPTSTVKKTGIRLS